MANKKFSDLTATTTLADADIMAIETSGGNSRKITVANAKTQLVPFGGWKVANSATASASSSLSVTLTASDYDEWMLVTQNLFCSTAMDIYLRVGTGVGPTYQSGASDYARNFSWFYGTSSTGTNSSAATNADSSIRFGTANTTSNTQTSDAVFISCKMGGLASGQYAIAYDGRGDFYGTSGMQRILFAGRYNATTEITGLQIVASTGNFSSGKLILLGRNFD